MMKTLKSSNLIPSKALGIVYSNDLRRLVKAMIKDYKSLIDIYRQDKDQITMDAVPMTEKAAKIAQVKEWVKKLGGRIPRSASSISKESAYLNVMLPDINGEEVKIKLRLSTHFKGKSNGNVDLNFSLDVPEDIFIAKFNQIKNTVATQEKGSLEKSWRADIPLKETAPVWLTVKVQDRLDALGKKWEQKFKEWAEKQSSEIVMKALRATDLQLKRALLHFYRDERLELIGEVIPVPLRQDMKMHIIENVSLIRSIQGQYHERIIGAVSRSITSAGSIKSLSEEIQKFGNMSTRRANLIAQDQTRKMYANLTLRRLNQVGIKKVQWLHTHAGKTDRPYHLRKWDGVSGIKDGHPNGLNGFIFDIEKPPVIQEATKTQPEIRGYPAQLPFCHCIMRAVIEE